MTFKQLIDMFDIEFGEIVPKNMTMLYKKKLINLGQQDIARRTGCLNSVYTTNSVIGTQTYGLSSEMAVNAITLVTYDGAELTPLSRPVVSTASGTPSHYFMLESTLGLAPVPDEVKEIRVIANEIPADMSSDSEISPIPLEFHGLIKDHALWKAFAAFNQLERAAMKRDEYMEGIADLKDKMSGYQIHQLHHVKSLISKVI